MNGQLKAYFDNNTGPDDDINWVHAFSLCASFEDLREVLILELKYKNG